MESTSEAFIQSWPRRIGVGLIVSKMVGSGCSRHLSAGTTLPGRDDSWALIDPSFPYKEAHPLVHFLSKSPQSFPSHKASKGLDLHLL
ncbi:hypothetical protein CR513_21072, partial [Mucuna pruriens]